jgi:uncharacterized lipoprotein YddW (UPF0748 family)
MITPFKSLLLSILMAVLLLFGAQWALAGSTVSGKSALIGVNQRLITTTDTYTAFLPLINLNYPIAEEFRGLWVTRFDWTHIGYTATTSDLDTIVDKAASAHFNALLFQVRGTADAYYSSTLEPWAARLTGSTTKTLGTNPGIDPLAYMITRAHQSGLQVHAYMNVYPAWLCDRIGPIATTVPQHPFWQWTYASPYPNRTLQWREWANGDPPAAMNLIPYNEGGTCGGANFPDGYLWASPANPIVQAHILSVAVDLATRYPIDGLHLDLVRYSGANYSSDPATMQAFSAALQISPNLTLASWQPQFQRDQISGLVARIYSATSAINPDLLLSAAVWPNYSSGYNSYYQDSKGWLANNIIDANMPMLYSSDILNDLPAWTVRAQGFIDDAHGRYVFPGISASYTDVVHITDRIEAARSLGVKGVALFSYGALNTYDYWDDLANGPFAIPATVPKPDWKP